MGIPCRAEVFLIPCKRFHLIDHSMKRLILTALLLIGFTVAANAQSNELTEKADQLALEMTQAVKDLMNMVIKVDEYEKKCYAIGIKMGTHMTDMSADQIKDYLMHFSNSIYYYFGKHDIDKNTADQLVNAFMNSLTGKEDCEQQEDTPVASKADGYARKIAAYVEDSMNGTQDDKAMEQTGVEMGSYLTGLSQSEVTTFKDEFYLGLEFYLMRIEHMDSETCSVLMDMFKQQFDTVFDMFL